MSGSMRGGGIAEEDVRFRAPDGYELVGTLVRPSAAPRGVALIMSATGVPRGFYAPFALWLAHRGWTVLTWDWRGIGDSAPDDLRSSRATMREWAEQDLTGALEWTTTHLPGLPIVGVGHSFGGQAPGLTSRRDAFDAVVTVSSQSGYLGHWPLPRRLLFLLLWYGVVPLTVRLLGYFPARRLGLGRDLPPGVALEWARWCRSPDYLGTWGGHRRFRAPILSWSFSDDAYATRESVDWLHERYASAPVERRHLSPGDAGAEEIGHIGFFYEGRVPDLWEETRRWIEEKTRSSTAGLR